MFSDLLKVLELLIKALKGAHSPDHKRKAFVKSLVKLHREINAVVDRGRIILRMEPEHQVSAYNPAVSLLSEQITALREIEKLLTSGVINDVLQIHLPTIRKGLAAELDGKRSRVLIRLTGLISYEAAFPSQYVSTEEANLAAKNQNDLCAIAWRHPLTIYDDPINETSEPLNSERASSCMDRSKIGINASNEELQKGYELLDKLSVTNAELANFIGTKFPLEDIL